MDLVSTSLSPDVGSSCYGTWWHFLSQAAPGALYELEYLIGWFPPLALHWHQVRQGWYPIIGMLLVVFVTNLNCGRYDHGCLGKEYMVSPCLVSLFTLKIGTLPLIQNRNTQHIASLMYDAGPHHTAIVYWVLVLYMNIYISLQYIAYSVAFHRRVPLLS